MKIDKTTYKDREKIQIGMTADHTSRPDKVLFFCRNTFFVFGSETQRAHFILPDTQAYASQKSMSHFLLTHKKKSNSQV